MRNADARFCENKQLRNRPTIPNLRKQKNKRNWTNGTIDNGHFIFQMFNGRAQSRKKFLNAVKTKQITLGERKEFNGDKIVENDMEID